VQVMGVDPGLTRCGLLVSKTGPASPPMTGWTSSWEEHPCGARRLTSHTRIRDGDTDPASRHRARQVKPYRRFTLRRESFSLSSPLWLGHGGQLHRCGAHVYPMNPDSIGVRSRQYSYGAGGVEESAALVG
jgi:hypothetical protein